MSKVNRSEIATYNGTEIIPFVRMYGSYIIPAIDEEGYPVRNYNFTFSSDDEYKVADITTQWYKMEVLTTISLSTTRTLVPIRVGNRSAPEMYHRGFHTCAGTMVFLDPIHDIFNPILEEFFDNIPSAAVGYEDFLKTIEIGTEILWYDRFPLMEWVFFILPERASDDKSKEEACKMLVLDGVVFRDVGITLSVHDLYTERTMTYVARSFSQESLANDAGSLGDSKIIKYLNRTNRSAGAGINNATNFVLQHSYMRGANYMAYLISQGRY